MPHNNQWLREIAEVLNFRPRRPGETRKTSLDNVRGSYTTRATFDGQDADQLRRYVDAWLDAARDFPRMRLPPEDVEQLDHHLRSAQGRWRPRKDGRIEPWIEDTDVKPFYLAIAAFVRIAADLEGWRLSGPCPICGIYFIRKYKREKKYCSGRCSKAVPSQPRMKARRASIHNTKLETAREAIEEWSTLSTREEWKSFAVRHVNQKHRTTITEKSLSRWVKAGELLEPKKERRI